jgi:hypothetical protein
MNFLESWHTLLATTTINRQKWFLISFRLRVWATSFFPSAVQTMYIKYKLNNWNLFHQQFWHSWHAIKLLIYLLVLMVTFFFFLILNKWTNNLLKIQIVSHKLHTANWSHRKYDDNHKSSMLSVSKIDRRPAVVKPESETDLLFENLTL